ncbi:12-(S)-hydroxy-5,8,10,14-eicosatetraenoic acid receptor-like [Gadus macrocephalus]|uniref:12-(S)-hydroxy-5,8,10,14-eicosatetraenoic acid receptor-like n=1 Tax=Gadus macrocephalus TaxID=80720 RepID=UPI0028CB4380|nr:12-(S)-hydroxy-5,8,10,14-eicosatetraenoic acid receptor-like [Gadus macrocephalus]
MTNSNGSDGVVDHCNTGNNLTYQVLSWLMVGVFVFGLALNISVLYIFLFRFKFWKTNSVFLFNIVVADFLLMVCLPAKAYNYQKGLRRSTNKPLCQVMLFMLFINRGASIAFLTTLSIDRYFNVVHLGKRNCVKFLRKSPLISLLIWLLLLPLTIPTMVNSFECCNSHGRKVTDVSHNVTDTFRELVFFTQILIPFVILVYCTVRIVQRLRKKTVGDKTKLRRAVFLVTSVVIVFSVCFLPCTLARAVLLAIRLLDMQKVETQVVQVYDGLMVLSYIDCLLDPLLYCFCCSGFRDAYMEAFCPAVLMRRMPSFGNSTRTTTTTNSVGRIVNVPLVQK